MSMPLPPPPVDPAEHRSIWRRLLGWGCLGCGGLFFLLSIGLVLALEVPNSVALTVAAAAAVLPVPTYVFLVLQLDRYEHEPWLVLVAAFLWGAIVASFLAYVFNSGLAEVVGSVVGGELGNTVEADAFAPFIEESAKGSALLILLLMLRREFDNTLDGIVYGSLVGIGFAMTENVLYFGRVYASGGLVGLGFLFYGRVVLGGLGHALYTGTTGAAIGYFRESGRGCLSALVIPLGYFGAVLQHALWNTLGATLVPHLLTDKIVNPVLFLFVVMPLTSLLLSAPGLVTLLVMTLLAWRRESNVIRDYLVDEVALGTLTPAEYAVLPSWRQRGKVEWRTLRQKGPRAFFAMRDFHQVATELAFRKWHVSRGEAPKRAQRRTPEDRYRDQLAILRARLA